MKWKLLDRKLMKGKSIRVIFDTNVWISFLIGKKLSIIKNYISNGDITIIVTQQLLDEIKDVTSRPRLKKYFPQKTVADLIALLNAIAIVVEIETTHFNCKDPKDNFLLDLIHFSKADYLVTGDKFLLELNPFLTATI
ncbi:MAG: putative toxin-antitoxin system toxin component, PIN family [Ferruginibacter sp.]